MKAIIERDKRKFKFRPKRDLDDNGNTNEVRADRALEALATYGNEAEYSPNALATRDNSILQDLICDLAHMADREGMDIAEAIECGIQCYMEER